MAVINPFAIEAELDRIVVSYRTEHAKIATRAAELTGVGKDTQFQKATEPLAASLEAVEATLETYREALGNVEAYERGLVFPPAKAVYDTATELAVSRVIARPGMDEASGKWTLAQCTDNLTPFLETPAATLIVAELEARHLIDATMITALLAMQPRYKAACTFKKRLEAGLNNVLSPLVESIKRRTEFLNWGDLRDMPYGQIALETIHDKATISDKGEIKAAPVTAASTKQEG
uniref:hypothetical protein n=1 Tax=Corynebacterium glutamicum TaxID=1718 RepID=UPI0002FC7513|nr:hypothetical protein [Corynebacterium glutamicum]